MELDAALAELIPPAWMYRCTYAELEEVWAAPPRDAPQQPSGGTEAEGAPTSGTASVGAIRAWLRRGLQDLLAPREHLGIGIVAAAAEAATDTSGLAAALEGRNAAEAKHALPASAEQVLLVLHERLVPSISALLDAAETAMSNSTAVDVAAAEVLYWLTSEEGAPLPRLIATLHGEDAANYALLWAEFADALDAALAQGWIATLAHAKQSCPLAGRGELAAERRVIELMTEDVADWIAHGGTDGASPLAGDAHLDFCLSRDVKAATARGGAAALEEALLVAAARSIILMDKVLTVVLQTDSRFWAAQKELLRVDGWDDTIAAWHGVRFVAHLAGLDGQPPADGETPRNNTLRRSKAVMEPAKVALRDALAQAGRDPGGRMSLGAALTYLADTAGGDNCEATGLDDLYDESADVSKARRHVLHMVGQLLHKHRAMLAQLAIVEDAGHVGYLATGVFVVYGVVGGLATFAWFAAVLPFVLGGMCCFWACCCYGCFQLGGYLESSKHSHAHGHAHGDDDEGDAPSAVGRGIGRRRRRDADTTSAAAGALRPGKGRGTKED